jgi:hypothetical protein
MASGYEQIAEVMLVNSYLQIWSPRVNIRIVK